MNEQEKARHLPQPAGPEVKAGEYPAWPTSKLVPADWRPWQKAPASLGEPGTLDKLHEELRAVDAALVPATEGQFTQALEPLFQFARAFGVPADVKAARAFYWQELRGHPTSAIAEAVKVVLSGWCNGLRLPMPEEIARKLPAGYRLAQTTRWRLERAIIEVSRGQIAQEGEL